MSAPWRFRQLVSRVVAETATAEPDLSGMSALPSGSSLKASRSQTARDAEANTSSGLGACCAGGAETAAAVSLPAGADRFAVAGVGEAGAPGGGLVESEPQEHRAKPRMMT